jgi:hypothetical protein
MMQKNDAWWIPAEDGGHQRLYHWPYLNRELRIRLLYGGDQKTIQLNRVKSGKNALIFIDSSVKDLNFMDFFPKKSVIVFFVSDETYSARTTIRILLKSSTFKVFRDYPIGKFSRLSKYPKVLLVAISEKWKFRVPLILFFRAFPAGIIMVLKQFAMACFSNLLKKPIDWIPLGYTYGFAGAYSHHFNIEIDRSILSHSLETVHKLTSQQKKHSAFFTGQIGGFDRQVVLKKAQVSGINVGITYKQYGGPIDPALRREAEQRYFYGLMENSFSISPPGNYSADTFRHLESFILNSYPLLKREVLSDPITILTPRINFDDYLRDPDNIDMESVKEIVKKELQARITKLSLISEEVSCKKL